MLFIALTVSNSVDLDQTAHIQELSDLCLQPFEDLSIHSAYSLIFDVKRKRPESTLHFFPPKKSRGQYDIDLLSGKEIIKVLTLIRLLLCDLIRDYTICKHL